MNKTEIEYNDKVLEYLEEIGYPDLILEWEPDSVAKTISKCIRRHYELGVSHRKCAIVIWSLTMTMKIIPAAKQLRIQ